MEGMWQQWNSKIPMTTPEKSVIMWLGYLEEMDRSSKTIQRYAGVLRRFLVWYESEKL